MDPEQRAKEKLNYDEGRGWVATDGKAFTHYDSAVSYQMGLNTSADDAAEGLSELFDAPSAAESTEDILQAYLEYNPELAQQAWQLTAAYQPKYAALERQLGAQERTADVQTVAGLAPQVEAIRRATLGPQYSAMQDTLGQQILGDLQMGSRLTPEQERQVAQGQRSAEASRGLEGGQGSANRESVARALEGQAQLEKRQQNAFTYMGQTAAQAYDPFAAVLGRSAEGRALSAQQNQQGNSQFSTETASQNYWNAQNAQANARNQQLAVTLAMADPDLDPLYKDALARAM